MYDLMSFIILCLSDAIIIYLWILFFVLAAHAFWEFVCELCQVYYLLRFILWFFLSI